jgi:L-threonylcarbamoyladenylate synthase
VTARRLDAAVPGAIAEAAALLERGGLVAFPTETVYGLGADALDPRAVARIFEAKARPTFDPLIVHLAEAAWLSRVVEGADPRAARLAARFWPGPLTLVLPRTARVPDLVTAGLPTVGVRVPDHDAARALISAAGTPVAAPSANPFGYVSPTTAEHVAEQLGDRVDAILDGGPCRIGVESTIVSLASGAPVVLRPGGVTADEIADLLGEPVAVRRRTHSAPGDEHPRDAPGQLERHYATRTPLRVLEAGEPVVPPKTAARVGLLTFAREAPRGFAAVERLAPDGRLATAAANLFAALRRLDALGLDLLQAEPCSEEGLGSAIMDRLRRCAAGASPASGDAC